jgi:hypothetical protein
MSLRPYSVPALAALLLLVGCGAGRYFVQVNGYLDPGAAAALPPAATIAVVENKEARNPLLEKEIAAKINRLLTARGYRTVPYEQADYFLFFLYGAGPEAAAAAGGPPVSFGLGVGGGAWRGGGGGYIGLGAPWWPYPYPYAYPAEPIYGRWLTLKLVEAKPYRQSGQAQPVWVGESRSTGTSSDLREVSNALLLAVFQQFGKNTGKAVEVEVQTQDPRYRELQSPR